MERNSIQFLKRFFPKTLAFLYVYLFLLHPQVYCKDDGDSEALQDSDSQSIANGDGLERKGDVFQELEVRKLQIDRLLSPDLQCFDLTCGIYSGLSVTPVPHDFLVPNCTMDDIGYFYSDCNSDTFTRSLYFFWKPPAICTPTEEVSLPKPVGGIACDALCESGQFLDTDTSACRNCPTGHYSSPRTLRVCHDAFLFFLFSKRFIRLSLTLSCVCIRPLPQHLTQR